MTIRMIAAALLVMACAAAAEPGRELRVVVLDPDGQPLPGANVTSGLWTDDKDFAGSRDRLTEAGGAARGRRLLGRQRGRRAGGWCADCQGGAADAGAFRDRAGH